MPDTIIKNGKITFQYFPQQLQELNEEVGYHQRLMERLKEQENKDIYITINEIAAYCGIILDGMYDEQDILGLCSLCRSKLYHMRTSIVIPHKFN